MTASTLSFLVWTAMMIAMLLTMLIAAKRRRHISKRNEDVAAQVLPELRKMAERTHSMRFGVPANGVSGKHSWQSKLP